MMGMPSEDSAAPTGLPSLTWLDTDATAARVAAAISGGVRRPTSGAPSSVALSA